MTNAGKAHSSALRQTCLIQLRAVLPSEQALMAEAETVSMTDSQVRGFVQLIFAGEHPETAGNLMRRVPDAMVSECIEAIAIAKRKPRRPSATA